MKRHLAKRVATAMALAGLAAASTSCGRNNDNGLAQGILPGGAALAGGTVTGGYGGCVIAFQGQAYFDQIGGITAPQLSVQVMPGQAQGGSFQFTRQNTTSTPFNGSLLEFNFQSGGIGYGGGGMIAGVLSYPAQAVQVLDGAMGYQGYGGFGGYPGMQTGACPPIRSLTFNSLAFQGAGNTMIVYGGQVLANSQIPLPY